VPPLRFVRSGEFTQLFQPQQEHMQVVITLRLPEYQNFQQVLLYFCSRCFVTKLSQEVNKQGLACPLYRLDSSVVSYMTDYDSDIKELPLYPAMKLYILLEAQLHFLMLCNEWRSVVSFMERPDRTH
jgi:hypothetical protein